MTGISDIIGSVKMSKKLVVVLAAGYKIAQDPALSVEIKLLLAKLAVAYIAIQGLVDVVKEIVKMIKAKQEAVK